MTSLVELNARRQAAVEIAARPSKSDMAVRMIAQLRGQLINLRFFDGQLTFNRVYDALEEAWTTLHERHPNWRTTLPKFAIDYERREIIVTWRDNAGDDRNLDRALDNEDETAIVLYEADLLG